MQEQTSLNRIIGSSLHGISGLANEFLNRLHREIVKHRLLYTQPSQIAELARERLNDFEPLLAEHLSDATLASWVNGYDSVTSLFPKWLQDEFATTIRNQPPIDPPKINLFPMFDEWEPKLKLPNIENAAKRLIERNILTRPAFDAADESAQREAFTIAGDLKEDTIGRLRDFLVDDLHSGTSLDGFENRVKEHLGTSPIAPAHLENVYRTNIQGALRDGRETIRNNPIVKTLFPYQEYIPIHDGRTRHDHHALGHLGLNGTGIYRVDDPFWDYFTPPWHYNCRCSTRLLTIEQAAAAGVHEAQKWLRTGFQPIISEHRLQYIPFPPNPGWGSRGRVGVLAMSLYRLAVWSEEKHPRDNDGQFVSRYDRTVNRAESRPENKSVSGLQSDPAAISAHLNTDRPIGISVQPRPISQTVLDRVAMHAESGHDVFVDSGIASTVSEGKGVDFEKVFAGYRRVIDAVKPSHRSRIMVVAPDHLEKVGEDQFRGDQQKTLELQSDYAEEIRELQDSGVTVIVPIQRGEFDLPAAAANATDVIDFSNGRTAFGIPYNKGRWDDDSIVDLARNQLGAPGHFHLLGAGSKKVDRVTRKVHAINPDIKITGDAASEARNRLWDKDTTKLDPQLTLFSLAAGRCIRLGQLAFNFEETHHRAPAGYTKDNPLIINGKEYVGGSFIPGDSFDQATPEQKKEIASGKKAEPKSKAPERLVDILAKTHRLRLKNGENIKIAYDSKAKTRGYYVKNYIGPDGDKTVFSERYKTAEEAARAGADFLHSVAKDIPAKPPKPKAPPKPKQPKAPPRPKLPTRPTDEGNFRYSETNFFSRGAKSKWRDNINAIRTLKTIQLEQREATPEEQETMSKYVGWGQFPNAFMYSWRDANGRMVYSKDYHSWEKEREELKNLIGEDEFASARASTINSHFTHPDVIKAHWDMAKRLGFKGGKFLEPSVGSGYYLGFMPKELSSKTHTTAVDMEKVSGNLAKALYPSANVKIAPFQDTPTPDNFYDLVATNVPFADVRISDPKYKAMRPLLHDYYFLRSVDTAKPGGLIMHLTSAGTMDKLDDRVRKHIEKNCELVSAIRFPGDTHKDNAGTSVVTDMLVLRKKHPGIPPATEQTPEDANPKAGGFTGTTVDSLGRLYHWVDGKRVPAPKWDDTVDVPDPAGGDPIPVNRYFAEHPEQILGTLDRTGSMYSGNQKNVSATEDYEERLQAAIERLPEGAAWTDKETAKEDKPERIEADQDYNEGQLVIKDGQLYQARSGGLEPQTADGKAMERIEGQIAIRDAARELIAAQHTGEGIDDARARLNDLYDEYLEKHGRLGDKMNVRAMKDDPDSTFLQSLENNDGSKADIFTKNTIYTERRASKADNVSEATGIVLHETGAIDIDRIAELTGRDREDVEFDLVRNGLAYDDPAAGWTQASLYLSGNTRRKLKEAKIAAETDARYQVNVDALEKAQPDDIDTEDIGIKLGAPWVPPETVAEFAAEITGQQPDDIAVSFVKATSEWQADVRFTPSWVENIWGVKDDSGDNAIGFEQVLRAALTGKTLVVRSSTSDEHGNRAVLPEATEAAREKVAELKQQFRDWVWSDSDRAEKLHRFYNDNFNNIVPTKFDGRHLSFPGMSEKWAGWMRDIQKDFVWRVVTTGKGLAAHEVGTGKTASMIASAMELRRLGLAKKPAIAVLKSNIEQFTKEALEIYPGAKILSTADMFDTEKRQKTLNQIATGDYDLIIMTHDHLNAMKMKPATMAKFMQEEIDELTDAILTANQADVASGKKKQSSRIVKRLEKQKQKLEEQLKEALNDANKDDIYFEESGIDHLCVDEAHYFKSLPCYSNAGQIKGIPSGRSQRATNMLARTRWLLEQNDGRGVVFATGTPIANTMGEMFNMQRYLQFDSLKERGVHRFDAWKDTYGDITDRFEFKLNGDVKTTTRFNEFVNLPELRHLASEMMDVQRADNLKNPDGTPVIKRPNRSDNIVVSEEHDGITAMMEDIHRRAEALKGRRAPAAKGEDNMLSVCNAAKLGSLDMRLIDPEAEDHPNSKTNQAVRKIIEMYHAHPGKTQAVFSDIGIHTKATRKKKNADGEETGPTETITKFSVFEDMKKKLIAAGIPKHEIVDFSSAKMKGKNRDKAQQDMKSGKARIAFGSTQRLGTGTNIQKNLRAIHHLDIPYVPAYLEQRDGRGYRSGNENKDIDIIKYVQQGSADNLFWQIVANKSNFINQYMLGKGNRTMSDLDTDTLTPDEMIAVSTGDPDMIERVSLEDEVRSLRRSQLRNTADRKRIEQSIAEAPKRREELAARKQNHQRDAKHLNESPDFSLGVTTGERSWHTERPAAAEALTKAIDHAKEAIEKTPSWHRPKSVPIAVYRGLNVHLKPNGLLDIHGPSGETYESGATLGSLEYAARRIAKAHEEDDAAIAEFETGLEKMRQTLTQPFRKGEELKAKEARLAELKSGLKRMSLQPGTTKQIGGSTYVLNNNHRWQLQRQPGQQQQPAAKPEQPPQEQPQSNPALDPKQPPSRETLALAAANGDTPHQREARRQVAMHYLTTKATFYDHRSGKMAPLDEPRVAGMLDGVDLSKPVKMGPPPTIPPPRQFVQWQAKGGYRGSYFALPNAKPADIGIYEQATAWTVEGQPVLPRQQTMYDTRNAKMNRVTYLASTAAPTVDTWSVPGKEIPVSGGGQQWFIPVAAHPAVRVPQAKNAKPNA